MPRTNWPCIKTFDWLIHPDNPTASSTNFEWTVQVREKINDDCQEILEDAVWSERLVKWEK